MSSVTNARSGSKSSNRTRNGSARSGLRSKSESAASNIPKEDIYKTPLKSTVTPQTTPSTPSSGVCVVCKGIDDLRSLNFRNAVTEFSDKIEAFKQLTKSFNDNNSTLSHALDTIKHFIMHVKPDKINDSFASLDSSLNSLRSEVTCLPNITYLENRLKALEGKLSDLSDIRTKVDTIYTNIDSLEDRLSELASISNKPVIANDKLDDFNKYIARLNSMEESLDDKIKSIPPSNSHQDLTEHISKLESLCTQLNTKLDFTNINHNNPSPIMAHSPATQSPISNSCAPNPNTCLILGDSNTKYIKIDDDVLNSHRIPTYLIEDIDPNVCAGYKKIWVHVGTNNIKTIRCSNTNDIHRHFNNFIHKLDIIRSICPHSKIIVSPIPPTAIPALNKCAIIFNRLLFSQQRFFITMYFNMFCGSDRNLMNIYRCYMNRDDKIHFGSLGIKILTSKIKHCISHIDHRSYASVVKQY